MFDITAGTRRKIYAWLHYASTGLASLAAILTAVLALVGTGPIAVALTSVLAVTGVVGGYVGKLAKDHTPVDEFLDAIDSVPEN